DCGHFTQLLNRAPSIRYAAADYPGVVLDAPEPTAGDFCLSSCNRCCSLSQSSLCHAWRRSMTGIGANATSTAYSDNVQHARYETYDSEVDLDGLHARDRKTWKIRRCGRHQDE